MFIKEFYSRFISRQERSNVFDAMRQLSSLDRHALVDETLGWPEWPQAASRSSRTQKA
jgi:hypothetical protein